MLTISSRTSRGGLRYAADKVAASVLLYSSFCNSLEILLLFFPQLPKLFHLNLRQERLDFCIRCSHELFPTGHLLLARQNRISQKLSGFASLLLEDWLDLDLLL